MVAVNQWSLDCFSTQVVGVTAGKKVTELNCKVTQLTRVSIDQCIVMLLIMKLTWDSLDIGSILKAFQILGLFLYYVEKHSTRTFHR